MASLTGQSVAASYEQLLHVDRDGGGNTTTLVDVKDGDNGTTFALKLAQYHAEIRGTTGTGATGAGKLNLSTAELTVVDNDVLGRIDFLAPLESSGTDAILAGASIWGEAEDTFAADNNSTALVFATNTSAAATERMRIASDGNVQINGAGNYSQLQIISTGAESGIKFVDSGDTVDGYIYATASTMGFLNGSGAYTFKVDANSRISLSNNDAGDLNTIFGHSAGASIHADADQNTFIGHQVADATMTATADDNTGVGFVALGALTSGKQNTAIGSYSLFNNASTDYNTAVGVSAGQNTTGASNTYVGSNAGKGASGADANNVGVGSSALLAITDGTHNTAVGYYSGVNLTTGDDNVMLGKSAGNAFNSSNIVAVGSNSLASISHADADGSVAVGKSALTALTIGARNTAVGFQSLDSMTTGNDNLAIGYDALGNFNAAGARNIGIGNYSGDGMGTVGNHADNIFIGHDSGGGTWTGTSSNQNTAIGSYSMDAAMNGANYNTSVGYGGLGALTTGDNNTAVGTTALKFVEAGSYNTGIGVNAGAAFNDESHNTFIGYGSGQSGHAANCTAIGSNALAGVTVVGSGNADGSVAVGASALNALTTGAGNVAIGYFAAGEHVSGRNNTVVGHTAMSQSDVDPTSQDNTFIGFSAGGGNWAGAGVDQNTAVGHEALNGALNGANYNVAIGNQTMDALVSGDENIAIGGDALGAQNDGSKNVAIGHNAMATSTSVERCIAIGEFALGNGDTDQDGTIAIGYNAGKSIIGGTGNVAIGYESMASTSSGQHNTGLGYRAAKSLVNGSDKNTAIGFQALTAANHDTSHENTTLGYAAGDAVTTGNSNTCLGSQANVSAGGAVSQIAIGQAVTGTADNAVHIGNGTSHIRCDFNADQTWDASSDRRQKKDIEESQLGLDFINDLKPSKYRYKSPSEFPKEWKAYDPEDKSPMGGSDKYYYGFIAQEVKEAVDKHDASDCGVWNSDSDGRQRISREQFVVSLIKAVQELTAKVEALEKK